MVAICDRRRTVVARGKRPAEKTLLAHLPVGSDVHGGEDELCAREGVRKIDAEVDSAVKRNLGTTYDVEHGADGQDTGDVETREVDGVERLLDRECALKSRSTLARDSAGRLP